MKRFLLLIAFSLILFQFLLSTNHADGFSGKFEYEMYLNFFSIRKFKSTLVFDSDSQLFSYQYQPGSGKDGSQNNDGQSLGKVNVNYDLTDTITNYIFIDKNKKVLYVKSQEKNKKPIWIYEDIPRMEWKIDSVTKTVGKYECIKATMSFRGRNYTAWFTPGIPVSAGPWKFNGLPGLIVELYDDTHEVMFTLSNVTIPYKYDFSQVRRMLEEMEKISLKEYLSKNKRKKNEDISAMLKSKLSSRGIIKLEVKHSSVEKNYDDIMQDE